MRHIFLLLTLMFLVNCSGAVEHYSSISKPNVVLFYTDDQGTLDAGCYGSKDPRGFNKIFGSGQP